MPDKTYPQLSRRERQIMDIVYQRGQAAVAQVLADLPDPPSYSAVRALMGILEDKGHLKHRKQGMRYVYSPTRQRTRAAKSALRQAVRTFFDGSAEKAVTTLLDMSVAKMSDEQLERLATLIEQAKKKGQ